MASVPVTLDGVLYDLHNKTTQRVVLIGEASLSGVGVGGGPIIPPDKPPGQPPSIWPNPPEGIAPIPEHPIVIPPAKPPGTPDDDGFVKPPPAEGGWAYHQTYGWLYAPKGGQQQPHTKG